MWSDRSLRLADLDVPVHAPETVRRITESVLSRPEFDEARPSWWEQVLRIISEVLDRAFSAAGSGGRGSVIGIVILAAVGVLIAFAVLRFGRTMGRDPGVALTVEGPVGRSARDWLDDAQRYEQQGRWREALRCRYRALLADLAAQGLVEEVPGRTTGEYLDQVCSEVPAAAEAFTAATRRFERAWYGHDDVTPGHVEEFSVVAHEVAGQAGITAGAAR